MKIYLNQFTNQSIIELLLANGKSAQDLLIAVVKMPIDKDEKFEPCQERIAEQTESVKFCINKGASLKGAFKNAYEIPAYFIENNLPLVIASQYDPTQILERISYIAYGLNNPLSLITKLINDYKADAHKVSSVSNLDSGSIEFLLSKGMKAEVIIETAFTDNDLLGITKEKQKELFDLAFKYGASSSSFEHLIVVKVQSCHEDIFESLIKEHKVDAQDLLNAVVRASPHIQELIAKQTALMNFLIEKGGKLKDAPKFSSDFIKNNLQQIIKDKIDIKSLDLCDLTVEQIKTLLAYSSLEDLLVSVTQMTTKKISSVTWQYELSPDLIAKQAELVQFCNNNITGPKGKLQNINNDNELNLAEQMSNKEEAVVIGALFNSISSYCKAVEIFQENDNVHVVGKGGSATEAG